MHIVHCTCTLLFIMDIILHAIPNASVHSPKLLETLEFPGTCTILLTSSCWLLIGMWELDHP